jgi:hypothetical protein
MSTATASKAQISAAVETVQNTIQQADQIMSEVRNAAQYCSAVDKVKYSALINQFNVWRSTQVRFLEYVKIRTLTVQDIEFIANKTREISEIIKSL